MSAIKLPFLNAPMVCLLYMLSAIPGPALGQQTMLEEIIVTAQKREQGINDVGITINVMSGELVQDLGISTAEDLARFTPALNINETAATGVPQYTLRGVGFQDFTTSSSATVGLYFDGVNIPYTVMSRGTLFDLERIEVLRGPQGDLYGRNTTAGQINFISKKPTEELEAGVTGSFGSYETIDIEGFVSGPISEQARGRFAFRTIHSFDGWQKSLTRDDDLGEKNVESLRGILDIDIGQDAHLELSVRYTKDDSENQSPAAIDGTDIGAGLALLPHTPLENYSPDFVTLTSTPPWFTDGKDNKDADWSNTYTSAITGSTFDIRPQRDNELIGVSGRLEWNIGDITVTSLTSYDEFDRREAFEGDGGDFVDTSNINTSKVEAFSQELIISMETDRLTWLAGMYYSNDDVSEMYHFFMPDSFFGNGSIPWGAIPFAFAPILELDTSYEQDTESIAGFAHVEWSVVEQLKITLGARYTSEERTWSGCTFSATDNSLGNFLNLLFGASLGPGDCGTIDDDPNSPNNIFVVANPNDAFQVFTDSIDTKKWMWKAGLDYSFNDDILAYFSASRGFKSGGFNGANSNATTQLLPYRPETLTAYELGTKMTLLDGTMQLNLNGYFYDYKDKQEGDLAVTFVGNIVGLTNIPKAEVLGAEVELDWAPVTGLNLHFGASYIDSEIKEWLAVDPNSVWPEVLYIDAAGAPLAQAPEWSFNGLVSYRWSLNDTLYLELAGDVNYVDESGGVAGPAFRSSDYTIFNVRGGIGSKNEKWRLQVWSRNVTDEYYFPSAFTGNGPNVRYVGMPRTVGVTMQYNFF